MSDYSRLLPKNASLELKALTDIAAKHLLKEIVTDQLWDPMRCPAALLPWLAWSYGVKVWDSNWSDEIKRQEIAQSVRVHQEGGTKAAIERALSPLDLDVTLDDAPSNQHAPHQFHLFVYADDVFAQGLQVDRNLHRIIERKLYHTKPARSTYELRVGERFEGYVGLGAAVLQTQKSRMTHAIKARQDKLHHGVALHGAMRVRRVDQQTHHIKRRAA